MVAGTSQDVLTDLLKNPETPAVVGPALGGSIPKNCEDRPPRLRMRSGVEQGIDRHGPAAIAGQCAAQRVVDEACSRGMTATERLKMAIASAASIVAPDSFSSPIRASSIIFVRAPLSPAIAMRAAIATT
jgi:hypothetical protein